MNIESNPKNSDGPAAKLWATVPPDTKLGSDTFSDVAPALIVKGGDDLPAIGLGFKMTNGAVVRYRHHCPMRSAWSSKTGSG